MHLPEGNTSNVDAMTFYSPKEKASYEQLILAGVDLFLIPPELHLEMLEDSFVNTEPIFRLIGSPGNVSYF